MKKEKDTTVFEEPPAFRVFCSDDDEEVSRAILERKQEVLSGRDFGLELGEGLITQVTLRSSTLRIGTRVS